MKTSAIGAVLTGIMMTACGSATIAPATPASKDEDAIVASRTARVVDIGKMPRQSMAEGLTRRYLVGEKTTLAIFDFVKGAVVPEHSHPNEQVTYIVEGHVRVVAGGETFDVTSGQVIVIPPGVRHSFEALEDTVDVDFFTPERRDWIEGKATYFAAPAR
ncbi:cupin domain-containing protein [Polyangium sp. y55x31]|uniref:cupin domain-containing protein n=1 Tax=Polyangium sp. y55x31 TaxID=3042688 RepID=UPI0024831021|nr:cupin domain-containing protein [Polyangium sp. y55x31]MDI1480299.1 cupin domain-containing protein [Polyangium sp. y55x31]